jgi:site-specific DNA-methyltransferase (adenine-specific)
MTFKLINPATTKDDWGTPQWLFDCFNLGIEDPRLPTWKPAKNFYGWDFGLDAAASPQNAKCEKYFTKEQDALKQDWGGYGNVWLNPPYGHGVIEKWLEKARDTAREHMVVVACLIPHDTSTKRHWEYVEDHLHYLVKGRVVFNGATQGAPFPSVVVLY